MRQVIIVIILFAFPLSRVLAHEESSGITNVAEADWIGPLTAFIIIIAAVVIARMIRGRPMSSDKNTPTQAGNVSSQEVINNPTE